MSQTFEVKSLSQLTSLMKRHARQRMSKVKRATRKAASKGRGTLKRNIPVAHGELRESVHSEEALVIVDAPHAAAVNFGSRPHTPPLEPLVAWVKLRGMQGLLSDRQMKRLPGTTTKDAAMSVAEMLRAHEVRGPANYSPTDAAVQVARAIQRAIKKRGTKPHHFIEQALPNLKATLLDELRRAMTEDF